ncbi:hypothetical protein BDN72DRAFT_778188, partial [Pluteus cervinus]
MSLANSSTTSAVKVVNLPKLRDDGSNWTTYKERLINAIKSKGLGRHLAGNAKKPREIVDSSNLLALTEDELEKHLDSVDAFDQKQAQLRDLIYETVNRSTFLQIKDENTAKEVWEKLVSINENKGVMVRTNTLTKLQQIRYVENSSMRVHISNMTELRQRLADMGMNL